MPSPSYSEILKRRNIPAKVVSSNVFASELNLSPDMCWGDILTGGSPVKPILKVAIPVQTQKNITATSEMKPDQTTTDNDVNIPSVPILDKCQVFQTLHEQCLYIRSTSKKVQKLIHGRNIQASQCTHIPLCDLTYTQSTAERMSARGIERFKLNDDLVNCEILKNITFTKSQYDTYIIMINGGEFVGFNTISKKSAMYCGEAICNSLTFPWKVTIAYIDPNGEIGCERLPNTMVSHVVEADEIVDADETFEAAAYDTETVETFEAAAYDTETVETVEAAAYDDEMEYIYPIYTSNPPSCQPLLNMLTSFVHNNPSYDKVEETVQASLNHLFRRLANQSRLFVNSTYIQQCIPHALLTDLTNSICQFIDSIQNIWCFMFEFMRIPVNHTNM